MFIITDGTENILSDTAAFLAMLEHLPDGLEDFFAEGPEIVVTRAPGRLDLMGGIADYSGSLVLQLPISSASHVALQRRSDKLVRIVSLQHDGSRSNRSFEFPIDEFIIQQSPIEYESARERFSRKEGDHWAAYAAGSFPVLMRETGARFDGGANVLIRSEVPEGKGVSSSAALEVSFMQAVNIAWQLGIGPRDLAFLCQKVENLIAGAPCGVMDQMTSACGRSGQLLELVCQPGELRGSVRLPDDLEVWGIDSGIRHAVTGSEYGTVRTAAFMGYRIIAEIAGISCHPGDSKGHVRIADDRWKGYLANLSPADFEQHYLSALPEQMTGAEFIDKYHGIHDTVTSIEAERTYPVLQATQHPIYENARVRKFREILGKQAGPEELRQLGELMYRSHASYSACGLGSKGTDAIVRMVIEAGPDEGLIGARITGGGNGGTVAVLGHSDADQAVWDIAERYCEQSDRQSTVISGSSPGADAFGHVSLVREKRK